MRDASEAATYIGDARSAFDAAALAVGATGGKDFGPLVRLCERGVAAADGGGGYASIEDDVRRKLAEGSAVRDACIEALARRAPPTMPPPDGIEAPAGFEVTLGSMAAAALTLATGREAGVEAGLGKEVSRASTLRHADWLGVRVKNTGNGAGGVEGDVSDPGVRSNLHGRGIGYDGWGSSPPASNPASPGRPPRHTQVGLGGTGTTFRPAAPVQPAVSAVSATTAAPPSFAPAASQQPFQPFQPFPAEAPPAFAPATSTPFPSSDPFRDAPPPGRTAHSTNPGNLSVSLPTGDDADPFAAPTVIKIGRAHV